MDNYEYECDPEVRFDTRNGICHARTEDPRARESVGMGRCEMEAVGDLARKNMGLVKFRVSKREK